MQRITTTNFQTTATAPIIPTEGFSEADTINGIAVSGANVVAPQVAGGSESIPEQANQENSQQDEKEQEFAPIPKGNFITKYREYADVVEVPADAHEAVAMALLAAVLNRNGVCIQNGAAHRTPKSALSSSPPSRMAER